MPTALRVSGFGSLETPQWGQQYDGSFTMTK
jgi:hypothetical protein